MSSGFIACPNCESLVLPDTAVCPTCSHVLDASRAGEVQADSMPVPSDDDREQPCSKCGEMVRVGLVRCWNCGEFMRDDIAATYKEMRSQPRPVIYSPLPDLDDNPDGGSADTDTDTYALQSSDQNDESDFELNTDDDGFDLGPNVGLREPEAADADDLSDATEESSAEHPPADTQTDAKQPAAEDQSTPDKSKATGSTEGDDSDESEDVAHSVATGGDALLEIALEEEKQSGGRKQRRGLGRGGFLVYCPNGHRIEVQDRHRGRTGRCPKCKALYTVPALGQPESQPAAEAEAEKTRPSQVGVWIADVRLHTVDPTKLKLKPGSLASTFDPVDVWCRDDGIQILRLAKPGLFGAPDKKSLASARENVIARIDEETPLPDLPVVDRIEIKPEQIEQIKVAQPAPYAHESIFAGVPVFGAGRIVVRLPVAESDTTQRYLSFAISSFRKLSQAFASLFEIAEFGADAGVPLEDVVRNVACHYSEELLKPLEHIPFYEADEDLELELVGWQCEACGLVVSEPARKKEKIGGSAGRGIAKAKCPKCKQKFGNHPLYVLKQAEPETSDESDSDSELAEANQNS